MRERDREILRKLQITVEDATFHLYYCRNVVTTLDWSGLSHSRNDMWQKMRRTESPLWWINSTSICGDNVDGWLQVSARKEVDVGHGDLRRWIGISITVNLKKTKKNKKWVWIRGRIKWTWVRCWRKDYISHRCQGWRTLQMLCNVFPNEQPASALTLSLWVIPSPSCSVKQNNKKTKKTCVPM